MEESKIPMTKEEGIAERMTPTGRRCEVVPVRSNRLYTFKLDGVGAQPIEHGLYHTSYSRAEKAMYAYLDKFWNQVEKKQVKDDRKIHAKVRESSQGD